jgi:HEAT repeat protein
MDESTQAQRIERLIRALKDLQVSVVWNATRELARFEAAAISALPALNAALQSSDHASRLWARYAIARITGDLPAHLPFFIEALPDRTTLFPGMAAAALAGFGPVAAPAVPQLIRELQDADAEYRWSAAGALAAIGPAAMEALPALIDTLNDPDEKVRWYSAWALGEIGAGATAAVPALTAALDDIDDDVRGYAARAIGNIGGHAAEVALPGLRALQADENPNLRSAATEALDRLISVS